MSEMEMEPEDEAEAKSDERRYVAIAEELIELPWVVIEEKFAAAPVDMSDVAETVSRFRSFKDHTALPCFVSGDARPMPVDVSMVPQLPERLWLREAVQLAAHAVGDRTRVRMIDGRDAGLGFRHRLARFLQLRADGGGGTHHGVGRFPGLEVRVNTSSRGGRVFYSPATMFRGADVFGAPTSPVVRPIGPGRYLFGVEQRDGTTIWDAGEHEIPPTFDITLPL